MDVVCFTVVGMLEWFLPLPGRELSEQATLFTDLDRATSCHESKKPADL
jgi:hypothetical protein